MGHQKRLGVVHAFHAKTTAHVRIGHTQIRFVQTQHTCQTVAWPPDTLPIDGHMQPALAFGFGVTAARLHGIDDDPVVFDRHAHHMGGL